LAFLSCRYASVWLKLKLTLAISGEVIFTQPCNLKLVCVELLRIIYGETHK
jgi:hypothetical protein